MKRKSTDTVNDNQTNIEDTNAKTRQRKEYLHDRYIINRIENLESRKNNYSKNQKIKTPEQKEIDKASRQIKNLSKEKIALKNKHNKTFRNKNTKAAKTLVNSTESLSLQWDYKNLCEL
jgi:hypothetical protein